MNEKHINKSPLPCGGGLGVGIIPQHEGRLGVGIMPQGYKQTNIGIIPQDWEVVRLGKVCKMIMKQMLESVIARQWRSHNEAIHELVNIVFTMRK